MTAAIETDRDRLRDEIEGQADWRERKAAEYPDDARNLEAARELRGLAATVDDCPDEVIDDFVACWREGDASAASERWSERLRAIGFSSSPKDAEELLRAHIAECAGL